MKSAPVPKVQPSSPRRRMRVSRAELGRGAKASSISGLPFEPLDDAHDLPLRLQTRQNRQRHRQEIGDADAPSFRRKFGLQHRRSIDVAPVRARASFVPTAKGCRRNRGREWRQNRRAVEIRQTEPVDRAVPRNERERSTVTDDTVVADRVDSVPQRLTAAVAAGRSTAPVDRARSQVPRSLPTSRPRRRSRAGAMFREPERRREAAARRSKRPCAPTFSATESKRLSARSSARLLGQLPALGSMRHLAVELARERVSGRRSPCMAERPTQNSRRGWQAA